MDAKSLVKEKPNGHVKNPLLITEFQYLWTKLCKKCVSRCLFVSTRTRKMFKVLESLVIRIIMQ